MGWNSEGDLWKFLYLMVGHNLSQVKLIITQNVKWDYTRATRHGHRGNERVPFFPFCKTKYYCFHKTARGERRCQFYFQYYSKFYWWYTKQTTNLDHGHLRPNTKTYLLFRLFNANLSFDIFGSLNPQGLRMLITSILIKSKKIEVPVNSKRSIASRLAKIMFDWRVYFQVKSIKRWKQLLISAISKYVDFIGVLQSNYLCNLASCRCRQKSFRISNYCLLKGRTYYWSKWVSSK